MSRGDIFMDVIAGEKVSAGELLAVEEGKAVTIQDKHRITWPNAGWAINSAQRGEHVTLSRHIII
jgi:hypothetical protein